MRNKLRTKKETTIEFLKKYCLKPKKRFGQTFLIDKEVIKDVLLAAELKKSDIVVEIGPGLGAITKELVKKAGRVIAVEKDRELVRILLSRSGLTQIATPKNAEKNIEIVHGDILKFDPKRYSLNAKRYKVVANLPFNIATPTIRKFLESDYPPTLMVLITQKEVAERICARPPKMSILAIAVQLYSKPKIVRIIKKESSWPVPKVDSAILKIAPRDPSTSSGNNLLSEFIEDKKKSDLFFRIVKAGFSQPRKQLKNNLKKIFRDSSVSAQNDKGGVERILKLSKINPSCRAETLSVEDWIRLVKMIK